MDLRLLYALILTVMPVTELRVGLPLALFYAKDHSIPFSLIFILIILVNILAIFLIFYFLDNLHHLFMKNKWYNKLFSKYIGKFQRKVDVFEKKYQTGGFLALILFVAVPLPGTGAWTGCLLSWVLGLERKKSIMAIATGVFIAGLLILIGMVTIISSFSF